MVGPLHYHLVCILTALYPYQGALVLVETFVDEEPTFMSGSCSPRSTLALRLYAIAKQNIWMLRDYAHPLSLGFLQGATSSLGILSLASIKPTEYRRYSASESLVESMASSQKTFRGFALPYRLAIISSISRAAKSVRHPIGPDLQPFHGYRHIIL